jgi:mRNA interferase MazF
VIIVPLTSTRRGFAHRAPVVFGGVAGEAATDQIRAVDRQRLLRFLGELDRTDARALAARLVSMFGY